MLGKRKELCRMGDVVLRISEMFGPTLQGEGRSQGKSVLFLRLGLCNLDCAWCDTPYTWDWSGKNGVAYDRDKELTTMPIADVAEWLLARAKQFDTRRVVITGGEPLIQQRRLVPLIEQLVEAGLGIEIETNGTYLPNETVRDNCSLNVSPKLASSGVDQIVAIDYEVLNQIKLTCDSSFKFVVKDTTDLAQVTDVVEKLGIEPERVHLMPEGRTREEILQRLPWLFNICASRGWNLSPRLHVLAFNDERGI